MKLPARWLVAAFADRACSELNPFGHPSETGAERFDRHGVGLLRADRDSAITALTDRTNLSVDTTVER